MLVSSSSVERLTLFPQVFAPVAYRLKAKDDDAWKRTAAEFSIVKAYIQICLAAGAADLFNIEEIAKRFLFTPGERLPRRKI